MPTIDRKIIAACLAAGLPLFGIAQEANTDIITVEKEEMPQELATWFEQFDKPAADPHYWGDHDAEDIDAIYDEIDETSKSPYAQFEDFTLEDLYFGYDEDYMNDFADLKTVEDILLSYPDMTEREANTIIELRQYKSELDEAAAKYSAEHRQLTNYKKGKAISYDPAKKDICRQTQNVYDFDDLKMAVNDQTIDCIQLEKNTTYTWPVGQEPLEIKANRHLSIFVKEENAYKTTKNFDSKNDRIDKQMKSLSKEDLDDKIPTTTLQGDATPTGKSMFRITGGTLVVSDVIVRRGTGASSDGAQRGGFIYTVMGGVKTVNCQFFFFQNFDTANPFNLKDLKEIDWKTLRKNIKEYDSEYLKAWKAIDHKSKTKDEKIAGPVVIEGGNFYIETGTLEHIKNRFNFFTKEQILFQPTDPVGDAQTAPLLLKIEVNGGYSFVGKGQLRTKLTKFVEFIPLEHLFKTKTITTFKLNGALNHVTSGSLKKTLSCVFVNQAGFPRQILWGAGFLLYNGAGNVILTGMSVQYNSWLPVWIGVGGALFNGAGNVIITGVFYNFNEAVSTFIGMGKLIFNGAGTLISTGSPALANYGIETIIGGATYNFLGAGVNINTGNAVEVYQGWGYRLCAGFGYFTGAGHYLLLGSPTTFANGALAYRGIAEYAWAGSGSLAAIGSPINDFSGYKWAFGYGLYVGLGAGKLMATGLAIDEFAGFKGCFGAGCFVGQGAGLLLLHGVRVGLYHGFDFTYGAGQVVFLGAGAASTVHVDVGQEYGYQVVNEDNPGVFVGNQWVQEQAESIFGQIASYAGASASRAAVGPDGQVRDLVASEVSISMAGEDIAEFAISEEGSCSICASPDISSEHNCEISEQPCAIEREKMADTPEEIILFIGELMVTCTTLKSIPVYPESPTADADDEAWSTFRSAKSTYKQEMRDNKYGCANPALVEQMLVDMGVETDLMTVALVKSDVTSNECGSTETYNIAVQSHDYEESLKIQEKFDGLSENLAESVQRFAVVEEQSNICTASVSDVNMNVIKAPLPDVRVTGEFVRGESVDIEWNFEHKSGLVKAQIELIRLREGDEERIVSKDWHFGSRADTIMIQKNAELTGLTTYEIPENLPGGRYVFRVTGISKIGTQISDTTEILLLGYAPRSVDIDIESVKTGEELIIPYNGFDKSVKITLQQIDPATEAMEKIAIIKQSARGYKGNTKPVEWKIPRDIESGDNYVVVVSPKNRKSLNEVDSKIAVSKPFSIVP